VVQGQTVEYILGSGLQKRKATTEGSSPKKGKDRKTGGGWRFLGGVLWSEDGGRSQF